MGQKILIFISLSLGHACHSLLTIVSIAYLWDKLHLVLDAGVCEGGHYLACHMIRRRALIVFLLILPHCFVVRFLKHLHEYVLLTGRWKISSFALCSMHLILIIPKMRQLFRVSSGRRIIGRILQPRRIQTNRIDCAWVKREASWIEWLAVLLLVYHTVIGAEGGSFAY